MSRYEVSLGVKIGVLDSPLKTVKKGKFYNCDSRNQILIKFCFRIIWFELFSAVVQTKKIRLKKKRTSRFLSISENFEHRFAPPEIKIFQIWKSSKSAMKKSSYDRNFKCLAQKSGIWRIYCYLFWDTLKFEYFFYRFAYSQREIRGRNCSIFKLVLFPRA